MAEGFARKFGPAEFEIFSAGSQPAQKLNPMAVEAMKELGIDISSQKPKGFDAPPNGMFDLVVGLGCGDRCPVQRAKRLINWEIPNPKGLPIEQVRPIRDQIEKQVRGLLAELKNPPAL